MIKKVVITVSLFLIIFASCTSKKIDVVGFYKGVLPCASCSGIDNELTLNKDKTFKLQTVYLGKGEEKPFTKTGTYKVENNQLELLTKSGFKYQINDDYLELLDIAGNKIESQLNYKLIKQK
ncbi:copper resistance protein NlpE [Polaribacter sargassicola]|uniref:copper resistance protein NlpE n=1 Tax=Polaribacter sargassicola TaxID=2836891 RepID=UPI001F232715|nr:copper resistance protein NlpE [Polaribacter sp. DS7-9]MCG1037242.1 copper resistance protein NlpE N-terminal domain-containing protein [Polaribacter sp. DS7-9]